MAWIIPTVVASITLTESEIIAAACWTNEFSALVGFLKFRNMISDVERHI
jgi:hypothetical protein